MTQSNRFQSGATSTLLFPNTSLKDHDVADAARLSATLTPAQVALDYAREGLPVLPCGPNKSPLTAHGFKSATKDLDAIAAFWRANPQALIGLPTGAASGLFVVDLDTDKVTGEALGEATLASLGLSHLLTTVPRVRIPSGGLHLYFRANGLGNSTKRLGAGVDTRGQGGYVIATGSIAPAGAYVGVGGPFSAR